MKNTFSTGTLLLGTLMFATVVSGRQIRGTNEQAEQGTSSIADSLLSWIRRDQEVDVQPVAETDETVTAKRSEIRARPQIVEGGLSKVFDEFRYDHINIGLAETKIRRVPAVKLAAELAHRFVPALLYVFENAFYGGAYFHVDIGFGLGSFALFEVANHGVCEC